MCILSVFYNKQRDKLLWREHAAMGKRMQCSGQRNMQRASASSAVVKGTSNGQAHAVQWPQEHAAMRIHMQKP